ncbi:hypothetical protein [Aquipseudomonas ullengensis]|uniref:Uncharacterized protein n=1 Tax=Aquipseudomonas ullengensis TaxID=2759166 RepID=A0A7W4LHT9_9GAMM|nr:hypothetical protein [Pseudomonas ullengensis]MBB2493434.1 hypothetical protein [Pseudomonas ullengensis]
MRTIAPLLQQAYPYLHGQPPGARLTELAALFIDKGNIDAAPIRLLLAQP